MATEGVALTALSLGDFRNYEAARIVIPARLVVLTGPNGAGKTNLLEAVSLLTPGRGLRRAAYEDITRTGTGAGWSVNAVIRRGDDELRIGTGRAGMGAGESGRRIRIDGAPAPSAESLLDHLRILWLTPAMDGLFTGPAGERRRFLDRLVLSVDPSHGRRVRDFERLLTQRNRVLEARGDPGWLDALEAQLAGVAVAVSLARAETVALLGERIAAAAASAFPAGRIGLSGGFEETIAGRSAAQAELGYREALAAGRARDRAAGRTLEGPHRSDLDVVFAAKGMAAALSSTGEQKALLIGLVLAHAALVAEMSGMTPVLLLDEVAAHLDRGRRAALFERLGELGVQAFMTGTEAELFADIESEAARFEVSDGRIVAAGRTGG